MSNFSETRRIWKDEDDENHRENEPAIIYSNGDEDWYIHGKLHREDGPAMVWKMFLAWYYLGEMHRLDGPARIFPNGQEEWWVHGKLHRSDGPAIIWASGNQAWYLNGREITDDVREFMFENSYLDWKEWSSEIWVLFNLRFR